MNNHADSTRKKVTAATVDETEWALELFTDHAGGKNEIKARPFMLTPFTLMTIMFLITTLDFDRHNCILPTSLPTLLLVFYACCFKKSKRSSHGGRASSVGMATRYGLDGLGFEHRWTQHFPHPSRPARAPPCLLHNRYRVPFPGTQQPGRGVDHYPGCVR